MISDSKIDKSSARVENMFNEIAYKYDFLNHFLSLNIDKRWRKKLIKIIDKEMPENIIDVATGTGDLAIAASEINVKSIVGIDISEKMLKVGREKIIKKKLENKIKLIKADSLDIPFGDNIFDAAMVAFGVRNFENLNKGLSEIQRVLKPAKKIFIIEFSKPKKNPIKQFYTFYFRVILPVIGRLISKNKTAYSYLPDTVANFPDGEDFCNILKQCGFINVKFISLSFGIASIYIGEKK